MGQKIFLFLYRANVESLDEENEERLSLEEMNISRKIAVGLYSEEKCSENVLEHDDCNMQPSYYDTCVCLYEMLPKVQKKLSDAGYHLLLFNLFQVILMNQMPLNNMAFLFSEYSEMVYSGSI